MTPLRDVSPDEEPADVGEEKRVWWRRPGILAAIIIAAAVLAFLIWHFAGGGSASEEENATVVASVQVAKAERGSIANPINVVATLTPVREATISPKISAQITQMPLLTNRHVHAGDVLAVLESHDLTAQRDAAAAALQEAEASANQITRGNVPLTNAQDLKTLNDAHAGLDNAQKTYERRQTLYKEGGISAKELEASKLAVINAQNDLRLAEESTNVHRGVTNPGDLRVAQSKIVQAQQQLANLDAQLSYTKIRAPFDGIVTEQYQYQGDFANPGTKLLTIADSRTLIAKTDVAEEVASTLKPGDRATVLPDDLPGRVYNGAVSLVGQGADPQSRSVEVWVRVPNPKGELRPNGIARLIISAQSVNNAVIVPSSAVTLDATNGNHGTVMVVDAQSVAHEVHVTIGIRDNQRTQITSGLSGGETVVTEGNYGLPDGTKVSVAPAAPEPPSQ